MASLRRQLALLEWALGSLKRRRGKTAVLGAVLTAAVFLLASLSFLRSSIRMEAAAMLADAPDLVVQRIAAGRQEPVPGGAAAAVRALPGVASVQERLWGYSYDPTTGANYTVVVPGFDPPVSGEAVVGSAVARGKGMARRDAFAILSYAGEVVRLTAKGVLPDRADFVAGDVVLVGESDFRRLFDLRAGAAATDLAVRLSPGADPGSVRRAIASAVPGLRVISKEEIRATAASFLDGRRGLAAALLLSMALALAIVAADKPFALGADERRELGVLRALGWSRREALAAKAWEALAVSLVALPAGTLAAYAHVYLLGAGLFTPALRGWAVLELPFRLAPVFDAPFLLAVAAAVLLLPAAGAVSASHRAASGEPDAVIREGL